MEKVVCHQNNFLKLKPRSDAITFGIGGEMEAVCVTAAGAFLLLPVAFRINLVCGPIVTSGKSAFGSCVSMNAVVSANKDDDDGSSFMSDL